MDIKTSIELTELFQNATNQSPHILHKAFISFENDASTQSELTCPRPVDAALWLEKILTSNDPLFKRPDVGSDFIAPVTFSMQVRYRDDDGKNEQVKTGIMLRFKDMSSRSEFHLHGHMTPGPTAKELISALKASRGKWNEVKFATPPSKPQMKRIK